MTGVSNARRGGVIPGAVSTTTADAPARTGGTQPVATPKAPHAVGTDASTFVDGQSPAAAAHGTHVPGGAAVNGLAISETDFRAVGQNTLAYVDRLNAHRQAAKTVLHHNEAALAFVKSIQGLPAAEKAAFFSSVGLPAEGAEALLELQVANARVQVDGWEKKAADELPALESLMATAAWQLGQGPKPTHPASTEMVEGASAAFAQVPASSVELAQSTSTKAAQFAEQLSGALCLVSPAHARSVLLAVPARYEAFAGHQATQAQSTVSQLALMDRALQLPPANRQALFAQSGIPDPAGFHAFLKEQAPLQQSESAAASARAEENADLAKELVAAIDHPGTKGGFTVEQAQQGANQLSVINDALLEQARSAAENAALLTKHFEALVAQAEQNA